MKRTTWAVWWKVAEEFTIEVCDDGSAYVHRQEFSPLFRSRVPAGRELGAQAAIEAGDVMALMAIDSNWVSSYCPDCACFYCQEHWDQRPVMDDGFYDYTEGTCPRGHVVEQDD